MKYDYLINQPRPASTRPKMSAVDRAAQFSSFAALIGLDEQLDETARLVDSKIELSEDEAAMLNGKFQDLAQMLNKNGKRPQIKVRYFVPDERKNGGAYVTKIGAVKRIDDVFFKLLFTDGAEIDVSDVLDLDIMEQGG